MPSLYETTAIVGDVSSSNFTTLYNSSGLSAPNTGGGAVGGNLNVAGNLTVQGVSLLQGAVVLGSTLTTPNYTFPLPDGTTDQVLVTDGSGNLYWTDVSAIPGAAYSIEANAATGGANLTLVDSAGGTDNVKFAGGTNVTVVRTDANTITISTTADDIPNGTARGQVLYWNGSAWIASSNIASSAAGDRLTATYENSSPGTNSALFLRKDYGATNYNESNNDGVGINFGVDSDSQGITAYGSTTFEYSATDPQFFVNSTTDNFATSNILLLLQKSTANLFAPNITLNARQTGTPTLNATITAERGSSTDATLTWNETTDRWEFTNDLQVAGDLAVNGGDITTTSAQGNIFNTTATDINIGNSAAFVRLGAGGVTNTNTVVIKPGILVGEATTQAVFNTVASTVNAFGAANALNMGSNSSLTTLGNNLSINGTELKINADGAGSPADGFVYFNGTNESLKWNQTNTRFEFSDQLYISETDIPAILERQVTTATTSPGEARTSLRLYTRVTDLADNDTLKTGPAVQFARTSGASGGAERLFASMFGRWDGASQTSDIIFNWTNDNFNEPTPGNFPGTYSLLRLGADDSEFYNNSVYIDYSAQGINRTATSITGGNTLVFGTAHTYTVGQRIQFTSTTQRGLIQNQYYYVLAAGFTTTQCQLGLTSTSTAVALTNGTGLTLVFADLINQIGINTDTPGYTLDVNGDANVSGDIYVSGVHINLTTPVQQGQFLYVSDAVTPTITNSSLIPWTVNTYRPNFQGDSGVYGRPQTGAAVTNNTGAVNYTTGDGSGLLIGIDSDSQTTSNFASVSAVYNASGEHSIKLSTSTNNLNSERATSITGSNTLVFPTAHGLSIGDKLSYAGPTQNGLTYNATYYVIAAGFTTTQCQVSLTLGGTAVTLTNGTGLSLWFFDGISRVIDATSTTVNVDATNLVFNSSNTGVAGVNASIEVERGTSGNNVEILWNEATDRWTTTTDGTTFLNIPNQNLDTTDAVNFGNVTIDGQSTIDTASVTTTSTATVALTTTGRTAMTVFVTVVQGANTHCVNATVLRNGATAMITTYGEMYNNISLANFSADVSGGLIRLLVTPTSATSTVFNNVRTSLN